MDTIKSSAEISLLFTHGARIHTSYLTLIVLPNQRGQGSQEAGRVAFIAGKKNGNAVWRNAAKRRMREVCHEIGGPWPGKDVVFLAKGRILNYPHNRIVSDLSKAISRSEML